MDIRLNRTPPRRVFHCLSAVLARPPPWQGHYIRFLPNRQRGATTLIVAILMLMILSTVVSFSTSVGVFEQRIAGNENRSRLAQAAAEGALGMAEQYIKANTVNLVSTQTTTGWLDPAAMRWQKCIDPVPTGQSDPCLAEADSARRSEMFRYNLNGITTLNFAATLPTSAQISNTGGSAAFPVTTQVSALLCRLDTTVPSKPFCSANPANSRVFAVTLVATANLTGESANAQVKETIASYRSIAGAATSPLSASGIVKGLGNAEILTSPNAGGWGVPVSIWSPYDVDISGQGGGIGSVSTCQLGDYLGQVPSEELFTTCADGNHSCGCPADSILSGHSGAVKKEGIDILDRDGDQGALPDITFFPMEPFDDSNDPLDDSLFEWIFGKNVVEEGHTLVLQNCGSSGNKDCAKVALEGLATQILSDCSSLSAESTGLIWVTGECDLPATVGTPQDPVVLVVEDSMSVSVDTTFFGMLFVRSSDNTATFSGSGSVQIFGSVVVEGDVDMSGHFSIIYSDQITQAINNSRVFSRLARLPGSWLDSQVAF